MIQTFKEYQSLRVINTKENYKVSLHMCTFVLFHVMPEILVVVRIFAPSNLCHFLHSRFVEHRISSR